MEYLINRKQRMREIKNVGKWKRKSEENGKFNQKDQRVGK